MPNLFNPATPATTPSRGFTRGGIADPPRNPTADHSVNAEPSGSFDDDASLPRAAVVDFGGDERVIAVRTAIGSAIRCWLRQCGGLPVANDSFDGGSGDDDALKPVLSLLQTGEIPPETTAERIIDLVLRAPASRVNDSDGADSLALGLLTAMCEAFVTPSLAAAELDSPQAAATAAVDAAASAAVGSTRPQHRQHHQPPQLPPTAPTPRAFWRTPSQSQAWRTTNTAVATTAHAQRPAGGCHEGTPGAFMPHGFVRFCEDPLPTVPSPTAQPTVPPTPASAMLMRTPAAFLGGMGASPRWAAMASCTSQTSVMSMIAAAPPQHTRVAAVGQELDDGTVDVNQYVLLQQLGRGRQGEVFLAMDTERNVLRAMKVVRRPRVKPPSQATAVEGSGTTAASFTQGSPLSAARDRARQQLEREITIMKTCRHRNVVALYEVIDDPDHAVMYIAMQYVEHGPLASLDPGTGAVDKTVAPRLLAHYARQLCAGLQYLHKHGVIHRDIKPENILLGQDDQVYLADFGMADVFDDAAANTAETAGSPHAVRGTRGTIAFMAPELVDATASTSATGEAVDVWALGVTLYALLYGTLPWDLGREEGGGGRLDVMEQITRKAIDFPETAGSGGVDGQRRPASSSVDSGTGIGGDEDYLTAVATDVSVNDSPSSALAEADGHRLPVAHSSVLSTGWPRLLKGMLHRDPSKRLGLGAIRRRVIEIERAFDQHVGPRSDSLVTTNNGASAISLLRHRSGRGFGNATPAEPLNQHQ